MGEIAPGVLAMLINLVNMHELNGTTVEVVYKLEPGADQYYNPIENRVYGFNDADLKETDGDWWGCILPTYNEFAFFRTKNLLPIGHKKDEDELIKETELEEKSNYYFVEIK